MPTSPDLAELYSRHLATLDRHLADALERAGRAGLGAEAVLFHAGRPRTYHRDDRVVPFVPNAHFRRWVPPLCGPEHMVLARPGERPKVVRLRLRDYWFDTTPPEPSHYEEHVDLHEVSELARVGPALGDLSKAVYMGDSPAAAAELGFDAERIEPPALERPLDWHRASKTEYELALTRIACEKAARGHRKARELFEQGASEREIHWAYVRETGHLEHEIPYDTIIALDSKSAILHYQNKRGPETGPGRVLLIDAGAEHHGYAADITRTFSRPDTHPVFRSLVAAVDAMERRLVALVRPGRSYVEIHLQCHQMVAEILVDHGLLATSVDEAVGLRLTRAFMPHGVGHLLGLQVHDVGGHQSGPDGGLSEPPDGHVLRNTRTLESGHLVTIEPGIYFIPMLLEPWRQGEHAAKLDWQLIDELTRLGGVRIEDDVVATDHGFEDLTRHLIEGRG
ncbi:MAG: Xaa-Pro dipeptidase [Holophagales bacterium]|nr:Xaa-Pro dipeptidase [Holophagales bacterium]